MPTVLISRHDESISKAMQPFFFSSSHFTSYYVAMYVLWPLLYTDFIFGRLHRRRLLRCVAVLIAYLFSALARWYMMGADDYLLIFT